jgi:hypothetical protein
VVVLGVSLFGLFTLTIRHQSKKEWQNEELPGELAGSSEVDDLDFSSMLLKTKKTYGFSFWLESLIILICPIPYYDKIIPIPAMNPAKNASITVYYLMSDFILVAMFVRMLFLLRATINYSIFLDIYSKKLCKSYGFSANLRFAFKGFMKSKPGMAVAVVMSISVLILAYALRVFELPYGVTVGSIAWDAYFDAIWCTIITMTTVGYGDVVPSTMFGRMVAIVAAIWGTFLISLLILSVGNIFAMNYQE